MDAKVATYLKGEDFWRQLRLFLKSDELKKVVKPEAKVAETAEASEKLGDPKVLFYIQQILFFF